MVSAILAVLLNPQADTLRYRLIDLGPYNRDRIGGRKVNNLGWVTSVKMWVWRPDGGWFQLPVYPGYRWSEAKDINEKCEMAVKLDSEDGRHAAAVWDPSKGLRKIEMPPGLTFRLVASINNLGEVVGYAY